MNAMLQKPTHLMASDECSDIREIESNWNKGKATKLNECSQEDREVNKQASERRGSVTVEMAVTVGLAFFFFFASFEFCRAYMIAHTVENAIYEGARAGIIPGATSAEVETKARQVLSTIGVRNFTVDVTPADIKPDTPNLTVAISVPIDENLFSPVNFFRGARLNRSFTMRREVVSN